MSTVVELIKDHKDNCDRVPWSWVVGLCVLIIFCISGSTAYTVSESEKTKSIAKTAIDKTAELQETDKILAKKIEKIEEMQSTLNKILEIVSKD